MLRMPAKTTQGSLRTADAKSGVGSRWKCGSTGRVGYTGTWREASFNWLALGLLLAAWNASNDDPARPARRRPESLRGYSYVTARAAALHSAESGKEPMPL